VILEVRSFSPFFLNKMAAYFMSAPKEFQPTPGYPVSEDKIKTKMCMFWLNSGGRDCPYKDK
jgi:hypothetical protein